MAFIHMGSEKHVNNIRTVKKEELNKIDELKEDIIHLKHELRTKEIKHDAYVKKQKLIHIVCAIILVSVVVFKTLTIILK